MSAIRIHSGKVILVEGDAEEFVPKVEPAAGMHGFAIMVPPGGGGDRLLDMVWRIAIAYAGVPRLLYSRANVRQMVQAVMSREKRSEDSPKLKSPCASRAEKALPSKVTAGRPRKTGTAGSAPRPRKGGRSGSHD